VNKSKINSHYRVLLDDEIDINIVKTIIGELKAESIPFEIIFENDDFAVINKQAGLVVHPSEDGQNMSGTLVNTLLNHFGNNLSDLGGELRPGIVHRLDKDTSGLMIIAKNNKAYEYFVDLLKNRKIEKKYIVLVAGKVSHKTGNIEAPIGRNKHDRKKFAIVDEGDGKNAITKFSVFKNHTFNEIVSTLLEINLITGRTHQIRVHFDSIGYPVIGDELYGNRKINRQFQSIGLSRQFLHAAELKFSLPNGDVVHFKKDLPLELVEVLENMDG